jgi:hypothetical protein
MGQAEGVRHPAAGTTPAALAASQSAGRSSPCSVRTDSAPPQRFVVPLHQPACMSALNSCGVSYSRARNLSAAPAFL